MLGSMGRSSGSSTGFALVPERRTVHGSETHSRLPVQHALKAAFHIRRLLVKKIPGHRPGD